MLIIDIRKFTSFIVYYLILILLLFGPLLSGGSSNSFDYNSFSIPFSSHILWLIFLVIFMLGISGSFNTIDLKLIFLMLLVLFLHIYALFGNILLDREAKFIFLIIALPAGYVVSKVLSLNLINSLFLKGIYLHALVIIILSFFANIVPGSELIFSQNHIDKFDEANSVRSSGLFLNNNSLGSSYLLMFTFFFSTLNWEFGKKLFFLFFCCFIFIVSRNFTGLMFSILMIIYYLLANMVHYKRILKIILFFSFAFLALYFLVINNSGLIGVKVQNSGIIKYKLFYDTIINYDISITSLFFGGIPSYTESTLIDLIYYFGFLIALIIILTLFLMVIRSFINSKSNRTIKYFTLFYFSLAYLLFVQNSVLLPINIFIIGLALGYDVGLKASRRE